METQKKLGIWMDHSDATLIDINMEKINVNITSNFTSDKKEEALNKSENLMHNKEQSMHEQYYKKIGDEILKYDHVLLFGPTHAKDELYNFISGDSHFKNLTIDVKSADKMTDNEKGLFVKDYFKLHE